MNSGSRKSFFLVEDETLIRMMISEMIEELGYSVIAEAGSLAEALRMAPHAPFDMAILDFNLGSGSDSMPVAEIIAARRLPFVFASGYVGLVVPEAFRDRPMLRKPFRVDQLDRAIREVLTDV